MILASRARLVLGVLMSLLIISPVWSYNRMKANTYALRWSVVDSEHPDGLFNISVYRNYSEKGDGALDLGGDCANFVCQCLNAGGIRFRHCGRANDNTEFGPTPVVGSLPEIGTNKSTCPIVSSEIAEYSRTLIRADELPISLVNPRHGSKQFLRAEYLAGGVSATDLWERILQRGDAAFHVGPDPKMGGKWRPKHSMLISTVHTQARELNVCTHGAHHHDAPITTLQGLDDWKTEADGTIWIVHIPDAPCIVVDEVRVLAGTSDDDRREIGYSWNGQPFGPVKQRLFPGGNLDLDIQITFDSIMDTSPDSSNFKLRIAGAADIPFVPVGGSQRLNGWWDDVDNGGLSEYNHRTWRGRIRVADVPGGKWPTVRDPAAVIVHAIGRDGSQTDSDNELSKYNPGPITGLKIDFKPPASSSKPGGK